MCASEPLPTEIAAQTNSAHDTSMALSPSFTADLIGKLLVFKKTSGTAYPTLTGTSVMVSLPKMSMTFTATM
jgi:hypothetical protein